MTTGRKFCRSFRIPKGIHEKVEQYAVENFLPRRSVYGGFLATALLIRKNRKVVYDHMRKMKDQVVAHPSYDQCHFQATFDDEAQCEEIRRVAKEMTQKYRPGAMYFSYHVFELACWLCLQGEIKVPQAALTPA